MKLKKSSNAYESAVKQLKHLESSTKETVGEIEENVGHEHAEAYSR